LDGMLNELSGGNVDISFRQLNDGKMPQNQTSRHELTGIGYDSSFL
jgi:hypothetical protein